MTAAIARPTLADLFRPASRRQARVYDIALIVGGSLLVALCAQIAIPTQPVPMSLQTLGVMLVGALLGSKRGAAALALYFIEGAAGLPVFAGAHAGLPLFTLGYLVGFVPAAFVIGWLAERGWDRRVWTNCLAMLAGSAVVFAFGLAWLFALATVLAPLTGDHPIEPGRVLAVGLYPFVPLDAGVKIAAATALLPLGWRLLGRRSDSTD